MAVYSLMHPQQPTSIRISVQLKRASGSELETTRLYTWTTTASTCIQEASQAFHIYVACT